MKGQAATEYLMQHGWAILIVLVVGITLLFAGVFDTSTPTTTPKGFSKIKAETSTLDLESNGRFTGTFINLNGVPIDVTAVDMIILSTNQSCADIIAAPIRVNSGEHFKIESTHCPAGEKGGNYVMEMGIHYHMTVGSLPVDETESGEIRGLYV